MLQSRRCRSGLAQSRGVVEASAVVSGDGALVTCGTAAGDSGREAFVVAGPSTVPVRIRVAGTATVATRATSCVAVPILRDPCAHHYPRRSKRCVDRKHRWTRPSEESSNWLAPYPAAVRRLRPPRSPQLARRRSPSASVVLVRREPRGFPGPSARRWRALRWTTAATRLPGP